MSYTENGKIAQQERALLISVYLDPKGLHICEEHLQELELLTETYGAHVIVKTPCFIRKFDASTYITKGKLDELIQLAQDKACNLIIFDDEIAPSQQRNLEKLFKLPVIDRTEVILRVFAQRAQTKEARLQVELAQVRYQAPRLKNMWSHLSRQQGTGGGGVYLKGEGEKQIEIDRRLIKKRIELLEGELETVKAHRETQRIARQRTGIPVFAIIGYTNVGKSTLLNALTNAGVFVENKLFATLDTTTRKYSMRNNQDILLIDTVGFIRKLPHLLVAAFRSTLEESLEADILLHLIDASHEMAEEQARTSYEVLKELNAKEKPIITVLNKIDQVQNEATLDKLLHMYPKTVAISATQKKGFVELEEMMIEELKKQRRIFKLSIPQKDYAIVSEVIRLGHVFSRDYEEDNVLLKVELPAIFVEKLKKYILP